MMSLHESLSGMATCSLYRHKELVQLVVPERVVVWLHASVRASTLRALPPLLELSEQTWIASTEVSNRYRWDASKFLQIVQLICQCQQFRSLSEPVDELLAVTNPETADTDQLAAQSARTKLHPTGNCVAPLPNHYKSCAEVVTAPSGQRLLQMLATRPPSTSYTIRDDGFEPLQHHGTACDPGAGCVKVNFYFDVTSCDGRN